MDCGGQYGQNKVSLDKIWVDHFFTPFGMPLPHFWVNSDNWPGNDHTMANFTLSLPNMVISISKYPF